MRHGRFDAAWARHLAWMTVAFAGCGGSGASPPDGDAPDAETSDGDSPDGEALEVVDDGGEEDTGPDGPRPIYVYVFDHTEDHINVGDDSALGPAEERWYRLVDLLERLRSEYPGEASGPWVDLQFYGAEAESLDDRNEATRAIAGVGLRDRLLGAVATGVIDLGYHGAHEPTSRSNVFGLMGYSEFEALPWDRRNDMLVEFLTCWRDPLYGYAGFGYCGPGRAGGLLETKQVLLGGGESEPGVLVVTGMTEHFSSPAGGLLLERWAPGAMGFGFEDHAAGSTGPEGLPPEYFDSAELLLAELAGASGSVYGLYYLGSTLVTGFLGDPDRVMNKFMPLEGIDVLRERIGRLREDVPYLFKIPLFTKGIYLNQAGGCGSPTRWAYNNPTSPMLPDRCLNSSEVREAYWTAFEEEMRHLIDTVFSARPGSMFATPTTIAAHVEHTVGRAVTAGALADAAAHAVAADDTLPLFVDAGGHPVSLAELLRLLADALAVHGATGSLPAAQQIVRLYGFTEFDSTPAARTDLSGTEVVEMATELSRRYALDPGDDDALYSPPGAVYPAAGAPVTTSGALRAMCHAYVALAAGEPLPATVDARPSPIANQAAYLDALREGELWSIKPAVWR